MSSRTRPSDEDIWISNARLVVLHSHLSLAQRVVERDDLDPDPHPITVAEQHPKRTLGHQNHRVAI